MARRDARAGSATPAGDAARLSFDARAATYDAGFRGAFHERVVAAVASILPRAEAVLDVGCGTGALLARLTAPVRVGVDPSPQMVAIARTHGVDARVAAAESLPFDDASFDLVVSTVSFHHWSDRARGVNECARVLQPSGTFVLVEHFATGWLRVWDAFARRGMPRRDETERQLRDAALMPVAFETVYRLGPLPLIAALFARC